MDWLDDRQSPAMMGFPACLLFIQQFKQENLKNNESIIYTLNYIYSSAVKKI